MATKSAAKKTVKKDYKIEKKRSGRFAVKAQGKFINGEKKVEILLKEGLVKALTKKKAKVEAPAAE